MKRIAVILLLIMSAIPVKAYNPVNLPDELMFSDAIEIFSANDITGGSVSCIDDGLCADLSTDEAREFYLACMDLPLKRTVNPHPFSGIAVNLYTDTDVKSYYLNSGVQLGLYGSSNYICYAFDGYQDEIMVMYSKYVSSNSKYSKTDVSVNTRRDFLKLPAADWAKEQVRASAAESLLPYSFVNKFNTDINREDFCILLGNMIAVCKNYSSLEHYMQDMGSGYLRTYFTDCENSDDSINMLHAMGIVNGKSETEFDPYSSLTREEATVMLNRTALLFGDFPVSGYLTYSDTPAISEWAKPYVLWANAYKIMSGISDTEFAPGASYTTEQAITAINRLASLVR